MSLVLYMVFPSFHRRLSQFGSHPCFMAPAGKHRAQMKSVMQLVVSAAASYHVLASRYTRGSQEYVSIEAHMLPLSSLSSLVSEVRSRRQECQQGFNGIQQDGGSGPRDLQDAAVPGSHGVLKCLAYRQGMMASSSMLSVQGAGFLNS